VPDTRQPCSSCPWRVGVDAWAIGRNHSMEVPPLHRSEMEAMARRQDGSFGSPVMACHLTFRGEEAVAPQERTCVGYALSEDGGDNLLLRLLQIKGAVALSRYSCAESLHPNFAAMLAANPERELARG
jgi:uncharacterized protein DUF6283